MTETTPSSTTIAVLGKIGKFDGKTPVTKFLNSFEKRAAIEKWSSDDKVNLLKLLFTGAAEVYVDSLPNLNELNYSQLKDALKTRFSRQISKAEAYAKLMGVRQNKSSIEDYIAEIESLALDFSDIVPDLCDIQKRDELLVSVFINGVDSHLKRIIAVSEFKSFSDISQAAKRLEATFEPRRQVNVVEDKIKPVATTHTPQPSYNSYPMRPPMRSPITCWECGVVGHFQRNCPQVDRSYNPRYYPQTRRGGRGYTYGPRNELPYRNNSKN